MNAAAGGLIIGGLAALYAGLLLSALKSRRKGRFRLHIDPFAVLLQSQHMWERISPWLDKPRMSLSLLNGGYCSHERLVHWAAESLGIGYTALTIMGVLALTSESSALLILGTILALALPLLRAKELLKQVGKRRQSIVMELPELLSKLLLMVNAGENVMRALDRVAERNKASLHPLYVELRAALERLKRGESLVVALEEMGRRCAVPEVKLFATTLLINARRGGDAFVPALRELTRQMWEKRKSMARTLGEQASSRLAFPLTGVFLIIMVLVGSPAIIMM
ncbi:type II secretion system F family protein [Cohnella boryungensis]|uniref:Type II secretion system F family protein n=1 Tax=Cohnella boryungensis TaxID=768479 RepID=A0ABV8SEB6_9BACL